MKVAILANCQARPLATLLTEIQPDIEISSMGIVHLIKDEQEAEYSEALASADVIIAQQVATNYPCQFVTTNRLRETYGDKVMSIVNLYYAGYNPEIMYLRLQGGTLGGPLGDYHLKSIVQSWGAGIDISDCINNCVSVEYNQALFAGIAEQSLLELKRREAETSISITKPSGNANSRIVSSVMSVGTFDAFFGQDTQTTPSGLIKLRNDTSSASKTAFCSVKMCTISVARETTTLNTTPAGTGSSNRP